MKLTDQEVRDIADFVSENEIIYNSRHKGHLNSQKIKEKFNELATSKFENRFNGDELYSKWQSLRKSYLKEVRDSKDSLIKSTKQGKPRLQWKHFNTFRFLNGFVEPSSQMVNVTNYQTSEASKLNQLKYDDDKSNEDILNKDQINCGKDDN